jgi:hypothetical protein
MMRTTTIAVSIAVLGGALIGGAPAFAATAQAVPAGGPVRVFATPNATGGGTIVIVGAIGDYGTTLSINKNGTANANGNYVRITLHKGTFEVNSTQLNAKANSANPVVNNTTTCSALISAAAPVTLLNGTGLYAGISGTVNITETFAFIVPRYTSGKKKGQCNEGNNFQPLGTYSAIWGTGNVSFS